MAAPLILTAGEVSNEFFWSLLVVTKTSGAYVPALSHDWLRLVYDALIRLTMPERRFKRDLVRFFLTPIADARLA